jgi:photosystem II protein
MQVFSKTQAVAVRGRMHSVSCIAKLNSTKQLKASPSLQKITVSTKNYPSIGFTRGNEILHGRMAMVGFVASIIGEYVDKGVGPLELVSLETGLSNGQIVDIVGFITLINVIIASLPNSATYHRVEMEQLEKDIGPIQDARITVFDPLRFFGVDNKFGFYTKNELFVGRVAMIGFAISVIQDILDGKGPLTELAGETHINAMYISAGIVAWAMLMATTAIQQQSNKKN